MREGMDGVTIEDRVASLCGQQRAADPAVIEDIVREVLRTMQGDMGARETTLLAEVEALGQTIASAKAEIAALRADDITGNQIPSATDELDAIVEHTAQATNAILEACEALDAAGMQLEGPAAAKLQEATTRIYEACSFQDITGQRITKVVGTLKAIEARVAQIVIAFGPPPDPATHAAKQPGTLLNGPQLPAAAMDQSDIDKLLASFD